MSVIYQIRCLVNNKIYIGSAVVFSRRSNTHKCRLRKGDHHSSYLQNAWNKYGESNFIFEIIEEVEKTKLIEREQYYLDLNKSYLRENGYNQDPTAGSPLGRKDSEETKSKKRASRKTWSFTEETKNKMSNSHKGILHTEETKLIISKKLKGMKINRLSLKLTSETQEFSVRNIDECLSILNIPFSSRTTIYQVINGKRDSINGFKITKIQNV